MNDHDMDNLLIVILAGGFGTRFWPVSTPKKPKQFLNLFGESSLLQLSRERIRPLVPPERVLVLTNRDFSDTVREQLPDIPGENIIGEPCRRDTAAASALAAFIARKRFGNPVIGTLTADHLIEPAGVFQETLLSAARQAQKSGALYTFGIRPTGPSDAYGYLERGDCIADDNGIIHYHLARFHEKPDTPTAEKYLSAGNFYWNSGLFVWTADAIIRELERNIPGHALLLGKTVEHAGYPDWDAALEEAFEQIEPLSIDYGVMEHAGNARCIEADFYWNDVGGWNAVADYYSPDGAGNRCRGRLLSRDAHDNFVFCDDPGETVALIGMEDIVVVRAGGRTLVAPKDRVDEIKRLLSDTARES